MGEMEVMGAMGKIENQQDINDSIRQYLMDFEQLKYGVAIIKNDNFSTLVQANPAYYKLIGYTKEQLWETHQNRINNILVDDVYQTEKHKQMDFEYDLRITAFDKKVHWIHGFSHYDSKLDMFFITVADISDNLVTTSSHLSYEVFQIRNEILGYLNVYATEYITVTEVETDKVVYLNPAAADLLGFKQESDWFGKPYCEIAFGSQENTPISYYAPVGEDDFTDDEYYNEWHKRYFNIKSKIINSDKLNCKLRLNIITDITTKKQLVDRIDMRRVLHNCIEKLFSTTTSPITTTKSNAKILSEKAYYDVLKQLNSYYKSEVAFFYEFTDKTSRIKNIYRVQKGERVISKTPFPIDLTEEQVLLLKQSADFSIEDSKNAIQMFGESYSLSLKQFHINYELKSFACFAINNSQGEMMAFMGVSNPTVNNGNEETKELLELLSRFVCMFLEHIKDQKLKEDASALEEKSKANIVQKCAMNFKKTTNSKKNIVDLLDTVSEHYHADFTMVLQYNENDGECNIPYIAGKKIPDLTGLQNQPPYAMDKWQETFKKYNQYVTDKDIDNPTAKMILSKQFGIHNFIAAPLQDMDGSLTGLLFVCNYKLRNRSGLLVHVVAKSISEYLSKIDMNEKIEFKAETRLDNKVTTQEDISLLLEKEQVGTAFVINIDNFKELNDTMGHRVGDFVLVELADNLRHIFDEEDVIGRIGGDEFMVFAPNLVLNDEIEEKAKQILEKGRHYYNKDGNSVKTSVSVGICHVDDRSKTYKPLYENADYALYVAKRNGKNRYHVYSNAEYMGDTSLVNEMKFYPTVVEKIKYALQNHSFVVHYQPLYHIPTKTFDQAEALVRMLDSEGKLIFPNDFIEVAESSGLVVEMTYQVLEQICEDLRLLANIQPESPLTSVAINVPYLIFTDPHMENRFMDIVTKYGILPSQIKLEITERSLISDMDLMVSKITRLRENGFDFELDDFGTDYSNLQMCISLPLGVTKLDRGLLLSALKSDSGKTFFEHIVAGIHSTGRQTVMEGVETKEQVEWATKLHCEHIQGYYFSKPLDFEHFSKFLRK